MSLDTFFTSLLAASIPLVFLCATAKAAEGPSRNRLAAEKSPYLLQHADNPVDWYPWGEEAFAKAKAEDKPVFLSIGYSTCHWCHVMEHESFEDPKIAEVLNRHFVSIKVDREERPDIDHVYMAYVTATTGGGGWPMSVFLTPEGRPFYGGTYFPPADRYGMPGFGSLLAGLADAWKTRRQEILRSADSAVAFLARRAQTDAPAGPLTLETLEKGFLEFSASFDAERGGFGRAPKFPRPHALGLLLRYWQRTGNARALEMVTRTLDAMAAGGLRDHLGGGFHRYSTDAAWHVPHFEKMLYDQALLIGLYTDAYLATGRQEYAGVARQTADYLLERMISAEGAFESAEDADSADPAEPSKKREGAYYVWTDGELARLLGPEELEVFRAVYGIEPGGNVVSDPHGEFTGRNVLHETRRASAAEEPLLESARAKLLAERARRPAPHRDDKILTDWNALAVSALARAGTALGQPRYTQAAERAAEFIEACLHGPDGRLLHRYRDGQAAIEGTLDDHAFYSLACLDLHEATGRVHWLVRSAETARRMIEAFEDTSAGGFYLSASTAEPLIVRPKESYDGAVPSGNSAAALALARLGKVTGDPVFTAAADRTLAAFAGELEAQPSAYPAMLASLDESIGPGWQVVVVSATDDEESRRMARLVHGRYLPRTRLVRVRRDDPSAARLGELSALARGREPVDGRAAAYVCRDGACRLPVDSADALKKLLEQP